MYNDLKNRFNIGKEKRSESLMFPKANFGNFLKISWKFLNLQIFLIIKEMLQ